MSEGLNIISCWL